MAILKKQIKPINRGPVIKHAGKGSQSQALQGSQMSTLTGGQPFDRTMNNYAKATPMANPLPGAPSMLDQGQP